MSNNLETTPLITENPYQTPEVFEQEIKRRTQSGVVNDKTKNAGLNTTGNATNASSNGTTNASTTSTAVSKGLGPNMTPQRSSRITQKLKLLPESLDYETPEVDEEVKNNTSKAAALKQYSLQKIKDRNARKDAERLGKKHRSMLPRVTTYCTAGSYKMRDFIRWLKDKRRTHSTAPKLFDECIYTPFKFRNIRKNSSSSQRSNESSDEGENDGKRNKKAIQFDDEGGVIDLGKRNSDIFIFEYGVIVMWGFTKREESIFLYELAKFENEKLADEDVQKEEFNYYITQSYQPRIYNDFITLRDDSNHMLKLSISYAISQSVKISLFEELVDNTIEDTQDIPQQISQTGKVKMTREEIMKSIGELFILRININLHGSILDSPELMWSEPELEPIYQATRGYLEINQRVALLNQRLEIISDLLQMLKEQLGHNNDEQLEVTVILLIGAEVLVSLINIIVDLYSQRKG